eukprot:COSAG01_NODE_30038_length_624_cov_0.998095_1_plen_36_part_10
MIGKRQARRGVGGGTHSDEGDVERAPTQPAVRREAA